MGTGKSQTDHIQAWIALKNLDAVERAKKIFGVTTFWEGAENILRSVYSHRKTAVQSGHSMSKDFVGGIVAVDWLFTNYPSKVLPSGPTSRQVTHIMFSEIRKQYEQLMKRCPWDLNPDAIKANMLDLGPDWYALGFTTKETKGDSTTGIVGKFSGFKSPNLLIIITEAQSVDDTIFDAMIGMLSSGNARVLELGNPMAPAGRFWEHCTQPRFGYNVIKLSCLDSPNYKARKEVIPGMATYEWVEDCRRIWGEDHPYWMGRILGEFPQSGADCIIPIEWIMRAVYRIEDGEITGRVLEPIEGDELKVSGTDVSKGGTDETVHLMLTGRTVTRIDAFHKVDINETVGWAKSLMREEKVLLNACDEGGLAGVAGFLEESGFEVLRVMFGAKADDPDFDNVGAQMWWGLRDAFQNNTIAIPDDPILIGQLARRRYDLMSSGKKIIKLKSKRESKEESPDRADALALAWYARRSIFGSVDKLPAFTNASAELEMVSRLHPRTTAQRSSIESSSEESSSASLDSESMEF